MPNVPKSICQFRHWVSINAFKVSSWKRIPRHSFSKLLLQTTTANEIEASWALLSWKVAIQCIECALEKYCSLCGLSGFLIPSTYLFIMSERKDRKFTSTVLLTQITYRTQTYSLSGGTKSCKEKRCQSTELTVFWNVWNRLLKNTWRSKHTPCQLGSTVLFYMTVHNDISVL